MNKRSIAKPAQKSRNFCFTWNNWQNHLTTAEQVADLFGDFKYLCLGFETGTSGTPHIQGYVDFPNPRTISGLKTIHQSIHWEPRLGSWDQATAYCKKDGNFREFGLANSQGKRTDLQTVCKQILAGEVSPKTIRNTNAEFYHKYGRTLEKVNSDKYSENTRTEMTEGIWYYGKTGVGKSHKALAGRAKGSYYNYKNDHGWWDGYKQQPTVIINEFREGLISLRELLLLIDKWDHEVNRRHSEPMPFTSNLVIITSALHPYQIFTNNIGDVDNIDQLLRRITVVKLSKENDQFIETVILDHGTQINHDPEVDSFVNIHKGI